MIPGKRGASLITHHSLLITRSLLMPCPSSLFFRPISLAVLSVRGELLQICSVDAHPVDLPASAAIRLKCDPSSVRRPGRLLVGPFTGNDATLAVDQIRDADLKTSVDARGVRELLAVRLPCRVVVPFALERDDADDRPVR